MVQQAEIIFFVVLAFCSLFWMWWRLLDGAAESELHAMARHRLAAQRRSQLAAARPFRVKGRHRADS